MMTSLNHSYHIITRYQHIQLQKKNHLRQHQTTNIVGLDLQLVATILLVLQHLDHLWVN
jgi:hypothetical protein